MQQRFKNKPRKFVTHFHTEVFLHHGERSLYGSCGVQSETTSAKVQWNESEDAKMPITKSVHSKRYIGQESIFGLLNFFTFDFVFFFDMWKAKLFCNTQEIIEIEYKNSYWSFLLQLALGVFCVWCEIDTSVCVHTKLIGIKCALHMQRKLMDLFVKKRFYSGLCDRWSKV